MSGGKVDADDDANNATVVAGGADRGSCSFFCNVLRKSAKSRLFSFFSSSSCNKISCSIGSISGSSSTIAPFSAADNVGFCSGRVSSEMSIAVAAAAVAVGSGSSIVVSSTCGSTGAADIVSSRVGCVADVS